MALEKLQDIRVSIFFYTTTINFKKNSFTIKGKSLAYLHTRRFEQFWQFEGVIDEIGLGSSMRRTTNPMRRTSAN